MAQSKAFADASHALNDLSHALALLESENTKLREFAHDLLQPILAEGFDCYGCVYEDCCDGMLYTDTCKLLDRAHELRVEVD